VEIAVTGAAPEVSAAVEAAFAAVAKVHNLMSFHEATSDVSRLNAHARTATVGVHAWTFHVLQTALDLHRRSGGVFDIAIAPVLQDIGALPRWHHIPSSSSGSPATMQAIELLPGRRIRFRHPGTKIDLGGIAKGFAVDRAIDVLRARGMPAGLVNAGGDLAAFGPRAHVVDLRDPRDPVQLLCRLDVSDGAVASSGGRFDPFVSSLRIGSAIIDPRTRKPACGSLGATVRASCCMVADALTKVVMIAGQSAGTLLDRYGASALFVSQDGRVVARNLEGAVGIAA
jgi:thiamine biosynthesis lipoprotein